MTSDNDEHGAPMINDGVSERNSADRAAVLEEILQERHSCRALLSEELAPATALCLLV